MSVSDLEERAQILAHALDGRLDSLLPPPADSPEPDASVAQRRNRQVLESDDDLEGGDGASSALHRQHSNNASGKRKRGDDSSEDEDNEELLMDRLFRPSSTPQANKKKVQTKKITLILSHNVSNQKFKRVLFPVICNNVLEHLNLINFYLQLYYCLQLPI